MRADVHADAVRAVQIKYSPQISLDPNGMDSAAKPGGEAGDLVSPQARIERILLEDGPHTLSGGLLAFSEFGIGTPKLRRSAIAVGH